MRHRYVIRDGKTKRDIKEVEGTWPEVEAMCKGQGRYAKRIDRGIDKRKPKRQYKIEDERGVLAELKMDSKIARRRRSFLAIPDERRLKEVIWELQQLGLPCLASMVEERLS